MSAKRAATWYRWDDMPREELHEKLSRRLITGDQLMLAHVYLKKGCVVQKHSHMNEQLTYILEGALRFLVGDDGAPPRRSWCARERCCICRPTCPTRPSRSRIRSMWTCSIRRARTGSRRPMTT